MDELSLPAGMTLINQGTSNHSFFVLIGGEVDITVSGEPRTTLGRGDFFGEITMGDRGWATATAVTKTPVEAYVLSHQQFGALSAVERVLARLQAAKNHRLDADRKGAE
jgi:CRP-like cAMP-binding protein